MFHRFTVKRKEGRKREGGGEDRGRVLNMFFLIYEKSIPLEFWLTKVSLWQPLISPHMVRITTLWKECFSASSTQTQIQHWLRNQKLGAMKASVPQPYLEPVPFIILLSLQKLHLRQQISKETATPLLQSSNTGLSGQLKPTLSFWTSTYHWGTKPLLRNIYYMY